MKIRFLVAIGAALLASFAFAAGDPDEVLSAITRYRQNAAAEAQKSGKPANAADINAKVKQMAIDAIKDVDPATVEPGKAYSWARLFAQADKYEDIHALCERFQTTNPTEQLSYSAHYLCLQAFDRLKAYDDAVETMAAMPLPDDTSAYSVAMMAANTFAPAISKSQGPAAANRMLDGIEKRLPEKAESEKTQQYIDTARAYIIIARAKIVSEEKGADAALAYLTDKSNATENAGVKGVLASNIRSMKADVTMKALLHNPVPAFETGRVVGAFKGLPALRGKVVILDFFAHWCPPCKAAFPDMRAMYDDLKGDGLEIVGLTTYYGYYDIWSRENRDMPKDVEVLKMYGFTQEFNINWPLAYIERDVFDLFGITGIPTTYVLDREGVVHSFHVGYSPELFKSFRKEIESLLKQ